MFGQLHYLAALGLPAAATVAHLFVPDRIFTHFERTERMASLRGKLQDDLIRVREIVTAATQSSVIIVNEIFASTTLEDALFLSRQIAGTIVNLDCLCVWVTFIEEVSALGPSIVSMVSAVETDNPEHRTFKILRQPANGLAYAMSIARKYRLTRDAIRERIAG
jgi:DNA mismatch repair ATPase MutS